MTTALAPFDSTILHPLQPDATETSYASLYKPGNSQSWIKTNAAISIIHVATLTSGPLACQDQLLSDLNHSFENLTKITTTTGELLVPVHFPVNFDILDSSKTHHIILNTGLGMASTTSR